MLDLIADHAAQRLTIAALYPGPDHQRTRRFGERYPPSDAFTAEGPVDCYIAVTTLIMCLLRRRANHPWQHEQLLGRKVTSPAHGAKRLRSVKDCNQGASANERGVDRALTPSQARKDEPQRTILIGY
jgi:hypothetical protein